MQKTTKIVGHFKDMQISDTENKPLTLPNPTTIILKDKNLTLELLLYNLPKETTYIGNYTITIKEP